MKPNILTCKLLGSSSFELSRAFPFVLGFLMFAIPVPAQYQEPTGGSTSSIVDAARSTRERKSASVKPTRVFTNEELEDQPPPVNPASSDASLVPAPSPKTAASLPKSNTGDCNSPDAQRLEAELQSTQQELQQLRNDLSYKPAVISDGDVDLANFKSGSSGLNVGAAALAQSQPLAPQRIIEVVLEEKISSLKKSARIACDSPQDAIVQQKIDTLELELQTLQGEFLLDQSAYYSRTDYAQDVAGKARLDAKQQRILDLQSEIQVLKGQVATSQMK